MEALRSKPFRDRLRLVWGVASVLGLIRLSLRVIRVAGVVLFMQILLGSFLSPFINVLRGTWILLAGTFLYFSFLQLRRWRGESSFAVISRSLRTVPKDLVLTAAELVRLPLNEFSFRAIEQTERLFPKNWFRLLAQGPWVRLGGGALLMLLLNAFLLFYGVGRNVRQALWPFSSGVPGILSIQPGHAQFPRGGDVQVTVRVSPFVGEEPYLDVRGERDRWERRGLTVLSSGVYSMVFRSLQEPLDYRFEYQGRRSVRYRLRPFDPPRWRDVRVQVEPPSYTGWKTETLEGVLSLRVLVGSRVRWTVRLDPQESVLRLSAGEALPIPQKKADSWVWEETVYEKSERRLWARSSSTSGEALLADSLVELTPDLPPQVDRMAPGEDLQGESSDRIFVVAETSDDVGLAEVGISYRVNQGRWRKTVWKRFPVGVTRHVVEKEVSLKGWSLSPGDAVDYFVFAMDRHPPPQEGRGAMGHIRIVSYDLLHEKILEEREAFHQSLLNRLAEQQDVKENLMVSTPNWNRLLTDQRQINRRIETDQKKLGDLVDQMARDPRTERGAVMEYRGLLDTLKGLREDELLRADGALAERDVNGANRAMGDVVDELERLSSLAQQVSHDQNVRRLSRDQKDLSHQAGMMVRSLSERVAFTPEEARQMQETADAMAQTLDRIRQRVEGLQKGLSKEFLEGAQVVTLRLDRVNAALSDLRKALEKKDAAGALAAAQEMLEELKKIERQLSQAGAGSPGLGQDGFRVLFQENLKNLAESLDSLIERQESQYARTSVLVDHGKARWLAHQTQALADLEEAVPFWESMVASQAKTSPLPSTSVGLRQLEVLSFDLGRALRSNQGGVVLDRLTEFYTLANSLVAQGAPFADSSDFVSVVSESRDLLVRLNQVEFYDLTTDEGDGLLRWAEEQDRLAGDVRVVENRMADISRQTALISKRLKSHLHNASVEMDQASAFFRSPAIRSGQESQEKALENLRNAQKELSEAQENLNSLSQSVGAATGAPTLQRLGGGEAPSGDGDWPSEESSRSPRGFRQEIMDSMGEVYPEDQEAPVRNYYRHWIK